MDHASETWDALNVSYVANDVNTKKYVARNVLDFVLIDDRYVLTQIQ